MVSNLLHDIIKEVCYDKDVYEEGGNEEDVSEAGELEEELSDEEKELPAHVRMRNRRVADIQAEFKRKFPSFEEEVRQLKVRKKKKVGGVRKPTHKNETLRRSSRGVVSVRMEDIRQEQVSDGGVKDQSSMINDQGLHNDLSEAVDGRLFELGLDQSLLGDQLSLPGVQLSVPGDQSSQAVAAHLLSLPDDHLSLPVDQSSLSGDQIILPDHELSVPGDQPSLGEHQP